MEPMRHEHYVVVKITEAMRPFGRPRNRRFWALKMNAMCSQIVLKLDSVDS
jgi:hypothetical protein